MPGIIQSAFFAGGEGSGFCMTNMTSKTSGDITTRKPIIISIFLMGA